MPENKLVICDSKDPECVDCPHVVAHKEGKLCLYLCNGYSHLGHSFSCRPTTTIEIVLLRMTGA